MTLNLEDKGACESSLFDYGFFGTGIFKDMFSPWETLFQGIDEAQAIPEIKPQSPGDSALLGIHSILGLHDACIRVAKVVSNRFRKIMYFGCVSMRSSSEVYVIPGSCQCRAYASFLVALGS